MSRSTADGWVVWLGVGLLAMVASGPGRAQARNPDAEKPDSQQEKLALFLPTDFGMARRFEAARDYVRQGDWPEAVRFLQAMLDVEEDVLVPVRDAETGTVVWTGVRAAAGDLVGRLPAQGREFFETVHGPRARALLAEVRHKGDPSLLEEVARRYFHTAAGAEATRLLSLHHLDRGRPSLAASCFARLLDRPDAGELPASTRFAAVLAFRLAGDEARSARAWKQLSAKAPRGVSFGNRLVSLGELEKELARLPTAATVPPGSAAWSLFRGDVRRSGQGAGFLPRLEPRWTQPTVHDAISREWLQAAVLLEEGRSQPILPAAVPVLTGDQVIYRTARGMHAVDRKTGRLLWESASEWGLDRTARELRFHPHLARWVSGYLPNNPNVLFENSLLGTLSTDGARVYAVEDLPVPPYPAQLTSSGRRGDQVPPASFGPDLSDPAQHSRLLALDAASGRLLWEIGGRGADGGALSDCHFLGPPLPLDGRLYAVIEKDVQIRLICLDAARGRLLWTQALAAPLNRLLTDVGRRVQAVHLAYADGVLVCPTNDGAVLGVDLFRRSLAWAYVYREDAQQEDIPPMWGRFGRSRPRVLPRLRAEWRATVPVIHAGQVVVTAPDSALVSCLDLRTGMLRWKADRAEGDLYLAGVHDGMAVVVGRQNCRALRLADGTPLWTVETGQPSGQGVFAGKVYYLPVKAALSDKVPAVLAIDLERGTILERSDSPSGEVPGNLVFCGDEMLSQTVTAVTAYPRTGNAQNRGN